MQRQHRRQTKKKRSKTQKSPGIRAGRFFVTIETRMTKPKPPMKPSEKFTVSSGTRKVRQIWKKYSTPKNLIISGAVVLVVAIVSVTLALRYRPADPQVVIPAVLASSDPAIRHPLTGVILPSSLTPPQVFGVMIENSADAWPLSGVDQAFLVIEAPVEGNIPRFIAFFSDDQVVEKIGPVRSARPYYLDWNDEFGGIYAHVGGSPEALELIRDQGTFDLDQFFQSEYFYRDEQTRYAPHNVYTTTEDLKDSVEEIREKYDIVDDPSYESWLFQEGVANDVDVENIHIDWPSTSLYNVDWLYDPATNTYVRKQGGGTYTANNVVVMATDMAVLDAVGRKEVRTIGTGEARVYRNGEIGETVGSWKKDSRTDRLRFYDGDGNEVTMNAGATWIEVVDSLDRLSVR